MNPTIWLIRVQAGNGWSDYPAEYGTMTRLETARSLFAKLVAEGKYYSYGLYKCEMMDSAIPSRKPAATAADSPSQEA